MMLFALPFFILFILRPNLSAETAGSYPAFCYAMKKWFEVVLCLEAVSGGVWFWIIAAQKCHQSPGHLLSTANLNAVLLHTSFGQLWLMRGGIVIALTAVLCFALRRKTLLPPRSPLLNGFIVVGSGSLLLSLAWAGHVAAGIHHQILHLLVDAPHLLLGAIWPMGLIPMACFLWQINQANGFPPVDQEVATLKRFSQISLIAVLLLVMTGSIDGWLMIGSWQNLLMTTHGRLSRQNVGRGSHDRDGCLLSSPSHAENPRGSSDGSNTRENDLGGIRSDSRGCFDCCDAHKLEQA
jgi:putative copper export protein